MSVLYNLDGRQAKTPTPPPFRYGPFHVQPVAIPRADGRTHYVVSEAVGGAEPPYTWASGSHAECAATAAQWNDGYVLWLMVRGTAAEKESGL